MDEIARPQSEIDKLQSQIDEVQSQILRVEADIEAAESEGRTASAEDRQYFRDKEKSLRDKEKALRDKEKALLDLLCVKEKALLDLLCVKEKALRDLLYLKEKALRDKEKALRDLLYLKEKAKMKRGDERLYAIVKGLMADHRRIEEGMHAALWLGIWGEISSTSTTENTVQFRKNLVAYYGDATDQMNVTVAEKPLRCMVTDLRLPGKWITAAHLFARKDRAKAHIFAISDIDDPRNGLLWNRAIEEAFSLFQIVFSWDKERDTFLIHILDKHLAIQQISHVELRKPFNRSLDSFMDADTKQEFEKMTFADLEGKPMVFNNLNRPFKRVLCLHAKLGIRKAKLENRLPLDLHLQEYNFEYWTDVPDTKILETFLKDSQAWIEGKFSDEDVDFDFEGGQLDFS